MAIPYVPHSCFLVCFAALSSIVSLCCIITLGESKHPAQLFVVEAMLAFMGFVVLISGLESVVRLTVNGVVNYRIRKLEVHAELMKMELSRQTTKVAVTSRDLSMISSLARDVLLGVKEGETLGPAMETKATDTLDSSNEEATSSDAGKKEEDERSDTGKKEEDERSDDAISGATTAASE